MENLKSRYESHHKVSYSDDSLKACVSLADRYITDREFPDKAIDIMDEVGASAQINVKLPDVIEKLKGDAINIKEEKIQVVKSQQYEKAAELRDKEKKILKKFVLSISDFLVGG